MATTMATRRDVPPVPHGLLPRGCDRWLHPNAARTQLLPVAARPALASAAMVKLIPTPCWSRSRHADPMQVEPGNALEDPVTGHELKVEHQGGGGYPPVSLVHLLRERMTGATGLI